MTRHLSRCEGGRKSCGSLIRYHGCFFYLWTPIKLTSMKSRLHHACSFSGGCFWSCRDHRYSHRGQCLLGHLCPNHVQGGFYWREEVKCQTLVESVSNWSWLWRGWLCGWQDLRSLVHCNLAMFQSTSWILNDYGLRQEDRSGNSGVSRSQDWVDHDRECRSAARIYMLYQRQPHDELMILWRWGHFDMRVKF